MAYTGVVVGVDAVPVVGVAVVVEAALVLAEWLSVVTAA